MSVKHKILTVAAFIWLNLAHFIFWFINQFRTRSSVKPTNDEVLLCSATELAKKIRQKKVSYTEVFQIEKFSFSCSAKK